MARFVVVGEVATPTLCDPGERESRSNPCYNPGISEACEAKFVVVEELATHYFVRSGAEACEAKLYSSRGHCIIMRDPELKLAKQSIQRSRITPCITLWDPELKLAKQS